MARKSMAATGRPSGVNVGGKSSKVKSSAAVKSTVLKAKRPAAKPAKSGAKSASKVKAGAKGSGLKVTANLRTSKVPPAKMAQAKATKTAPEKAVSVKPAAKTQGKGEQQVLAKAKAALKKESSVVVKLTKAKAKPEISPAQMVKAPSKSKARKLAIEISANEAASALAQKWVALYRKAEQIEARPYSMRLVFEEKTAIVHKVLGWGYILANRNDRLEVLFKDGIKYLISNYKP